jgi:uncharacterized membrane protein
MAAIRAMVIGTRAEWSSRKLVIIGELIVRFGGRGINAAQGVSGGLLRWWGAVWRIHRGVGAVRAGRGTLLVLALALVWGANFLWIKVALGVFSPVQVTVVRVVLGAVLLVGVAVARRRVALPSQVRVWGHLFVAALMGNAVPYLAFALGETRVDSGIAGALNATTPLWTLVLSVLVRYSAPSVVQGGWGGSWV